MTPGLRYVYFVACGIGCYVAVQRSNWVTITLIVLSCTWALTLTLTLTLTRDPEAFEFTLWNEMCRQQPLGLLLIRISVV